jgi:hypothetical protein
MSQDTNQQGAIKATEGQTREVPYRGKAARAGYQRGGRVHTFERPALGAVPPVSSIAFSGRGFLPNLLASHAMVTLPEASATTLENEGVHGREGMMPVAGRLTRLQQGQKLDEGSGGAGSFATVPAFGAKTNG